MLFASIDLAARVERAECALLMAGFESAARRLGGAADGPSLATSPRTPGETPARRLGGAPFAIPLAGGVAVFTEPGSPIVKVAGLGFGGLPDDATLAAVEHAYAERGCAVQVELSTLGAPAVGTLLTGRGYSLVGFENVLGRALPATLPPPPPAIEVVRADGLEAWLDAVVTGFLSPDGEGVPSHEEHDRGALERVARDFAGADGVASYAAWDRGVLAGGGSLRLHDGVALLAGASTLPAHRRRGVQSALLAARLADASAAGCNLAVVTTQPGSRSQQNAQRRGFELLYARAVLVKAA